MIKLKTVNDSILSSLVYLLHYFPCTQHTLLISTFQLFTLKFRYLYFLNLFLTFLLCSWSWKSASHKDFHIVNWLESWTNKIYASWKLSNSIYYMHLTIIADYNNLVFSWNAILLKKRQNTSSLNVFFSAIVKYIWSDKNEITKIDLKLSGAKLK